MSAPSTPQEPDHLTQPQRWAGLYTTGLMALLLIFFALHQSMHSGFFTSRFGYAEQIALYVPIILAMLAPIQRLIQGKRNPARPLEALTDLSLAIGSLWLWNHFPFSFSHIADIFPLRMHFAFSWITDNIGRLILLLQIVVGFLSALGTVAAYRSERRGKG